MRLEPLAIAHSANQRSVARQEPRPPGSAPVLSQDSRELEGHWAQRPASRYLHVQIFLKLREHLPDLSGFAQLFEGVLQGIVVSQSQQRR